MPLVLVVMLSGSFYTSWNRDGNLWKQDKLGDLYLLPQFSVFPLLLEFYLEFPAADTEVLFCVRIRSNEEAKRNDTVSKCI